MRDVCLKQPTLGNLDRVTLFVAYKACNPSLMVVNVPYIVVDRKCVSLLCRELPAVTSLQMYD